MPKPSCCQRPLRAGADPEELARKTVSLAWDDHGRLQHFCEPEEGRFNVWNQTFTDGDMEKAAIALYFLEFPELPSLTIRGETPQPMGFYARYEGLIELFSIFLWLSTRLTVRSV